MKSLIGCLSCSLLLVLFRSRLIWLPTLSLFPLSMLSFLCCFDPGLSGTAPPTFVSLLFIAFLFVLSRSRLIWDSPALSFLYTFSLSCLCCLDPVLSGTSPFDSMLWFNPSSLFFFWDSRFKSFGCTGSQQLLSLHRNHSLTAFLVLSCLCSLGPGLSGTHPFLYLSYHCFLSCLFRSRLIWDSPPFHFFTLFRFLVYFV